MNSKENTLSKLLALLLLPALTLFLLGCDKQNIKENSMQTKSPESLAQDSLAYSLPGSDPGAHQSPINIFTNRTREEHEQHQFVVHFQDEITAVENLGHTIQLDFKQGSTINVGGITYNFKQMHFHTPSEHLIDGITFPMELHIVSATENPASPQYLVIAILFKMGEESKFINEFLNTIPDHEHSKTDTKVGSIRFTDLLSLSPSGELGHHYHYKGSLTTPPYTESVNWFVLKQIFEASPEQIKAINKLEGDNARHIKDKNNRLVEDN
jgi:carbonic anhydrase